MLRSSILGFGFLTAAGCVSMAGCAEDSAGGKADGMGDAGAGGSAAGGRAATGGSASGGRASGGAASGGAGTGGTASGGTASGGTASGGVGTGGDTSDASTADASSGGAPGDASADDGSTDAGAGGAPGTGGAAGAGGAGTGGSSSVLTCGSAPHARLWVGASILLDHPTGPVTASSPACPGTTFDLTPTTPATRPGQTGIDAQFFDVPDDTPVHLRATQAGSFPLLTQEVRPDKDSFLAQAFDFAALVNLGMVATDSGFTSLDPAWNASTRGILLLQIASLVNTGPCADGTGITVTVDGHPEATGLNGLTPIVTATGTNGTYVFVTTTGTSTAAEFLTLTLTKTGCSVRTTGYDASPGLATSLTGRYPVEAGALTWGLAAIQNQN